MMKIARKPAAMNWFRKVDSRFIFRKSTNR